MNNVEDEFLINYVSAMLEEPSLDPKKMQVALIAFMGKKAGLSFPGSRSHLDRSADG
jgi:hypothetical protein